MGFGVLQRDSTQELGLWKKSFAINPFYKGVFVFRGCCDELTQTRRPNVTALYSLMIWGQEV